MSDSRAIADAEKAIIRAWIAAGVKVPGPEELDLLTVVTGMVVVIPKVHEPS